MNGQVTDRYTKAVELLGRQEMFVRVGGAFALERLMNDSRSDHPVIVDVLASFVHGRAPVHGPSEASQTPNSEKSVGARPRELRPDEDVQSALAVLARRRRLPGERPVDLHGTDLSGARLGGANLAEADLRGCVLRDARLNDCVLAKAKLNGSDLSDASLDRAILVGTFLIKANLADSVLRGAVLRGPELGDSILTGAFMQDVVLDGADLTRADLAGAQLYRGALSAEQRRAALNADAIVDQEA